MGLKMKDDDEVTFHLHTTSDNLVYTLRVESPTPMATQDFILSLEAYLSDIIRAQKQLEDPAIIVH